MRSSYMEMANNQSGSLRDQHLADKAYCIVVHTVVQEKQRRLIARD